MEEFPDFVDPLMIAEERAVANYPGTKPEVINEINYPDFAQNLESLGFCGVMLNLQIGHSVIVIEPKDYDNPAVKVFESIRKSVKDGQLSEYALHQATIDIVNGKFEDVYSSFYSKV